jgi:hypothetical protein
MKTTITSTALRVLSAPFPLGPRLSTTRNCLPRCPRLYQEMSQVFLTLPHMAPMFCHWCHCHSFKFASLPARFWARLAVLHTFSFMRIYPDSKYFVLLPNYSFYCSILSWGIIHDV